MRGKFLDPSHPFFRPLWVRVAVVGLSLGWGVIELVFGSPGWAMLFAGAGLYALWVFVTDTGETDKGGVPPGDSKG